MKTKYTLYSILLSLLFFTNMLSAQMVHSDSVITEEKSRKAWEVGIGVSVFQFSRVDFTNFIKIEDQYQLDLQLRHNVIGGNLYIARELNSHFYIDLQGTVGFTKQWVNDKNKTKTLYMIGPGLQWRLGEYFDSKYVDPYFRVGVSYMKKNFDMNFYGIEGDLPSEMEWVLENINNKHGVDRNNLIPISLGLGLNTWLNDDFGIGLQADYLVMPYKNVANSMQGTVRVMWRIGGESKKTKPLIKYVDREVIVPAPPVKIEKKVKEPIYRATKICELFNSIYFDFDKFTITSESHKVLDKIANILKKDTSKRYLITGYTDAWGSAKYNLNLSKQRVAAVVNELQKRGVPRKMMKYRGVGKKVAYASKEASVKVRRGDRKVVVEIITNMDYWNYIPDNDSDL